MSDDRFVRPEPWLGSGLTDKLYWRRSAPGGRFHCFKKYQGGVAVWQSLCGDHEIVRSGGQACDRPNPWARCPICDGREMERRGWSESGPTRLLSLSVTEDG